MAASQAFKNRMNMRIDALKSQKGKISSKLKEANLKVRAQRAMHTTGAFIGGGAAAVLASTSDGMLAGATYRLVSDKYASWRTEEE